MSQLGILDFCVATLGKRDNVIHFTIIDMGDLLRTNSASFIAFKERGFVRKTVKASLIISSFYYLLQRVTPFLKSSFDTSGICCPQSDCVIKVSIMDAHFYVFFTNSVLVFNNVSFLIAGEPKHDYVIYSFIYRTLPFTRVNVVISLGVSSKSLFTKNSEGQIDRMTKFFSIFFLILIRNLALVTHVIV